MLDSVLLACLGLFGGAVSARLLPAPLAAIDSLWARLGCGAVCGALFAFTAARPIAATLQRPEYVELIAIVVGFGGLAFVFKVVATWNELDLGGYIKNVLDKWTGRSSQ